MDTGVGALEPVLRVTSGITLLHIGQNVRFGVFSLRNFPGMIAATAIVMLGLLLIFSSVYRSKYLEGRKAAVLVLVVVSFALMVQLSEDPSMGIDNDVSLFSRYSADLVLEGKNPYSHYMTSAFERYEQATEYGYFFYVGSYGYPALSFLYFLPQLLLGIQNLNLTALIFMSATYLLLTWFSPRELALAPFLVIFSNPDMLALSIENYFGFLWILPFIIAIHHWKKEQRGKSAFFLGLSFATKQIVWPVAPFLAIWLYAESDEYNDFIQEIKKTVFFGGTGFLLPNLPFILWDPARWFKAVFPLGRETSFVQGMGLNFVNSFGLATLPVEFFSYAMYASLLGLLAFYALYFERVKWSAWVMPMLIMWFNFYSFNKYFVYFGVVAVAVVLLNSRKYLESGKDAETSRT